MGTYVAQVNGVGLGGGGPVLTLGDEKMFFNVSAPVYAGATFSNATDLGDSTFWAALPSIGFSRRLSRTVRLNVELYKPISPNFDVDNATVWAVLYGVRLFGDEIYGDVSFLIPIYPSAGDLLKYAPLGLPLLTFGYRWGG